MGQGLRRSEALRDAEASLVLRRVAGETEARPDIELERVVHPVGHGEVGGRLGECPRVREAEQPAAPSLPDQALATYVALHSSTRARSSPRASDNDGASPRQTMNGRRLLVGIRPAEVITSSPYPLN